MADLSPEALAQLSSQLAAIRIELARTQQALASEQRANEELRELAARKDELLATVSHDLKTPLTSMIGFAGLLARTVPPDLMNYVEPITRNGKAMAGLIEGLLEYSRLEAGHAELRPVPVWLAEVVQEVIAQYVGREPEQDFVNEVASDMQVTLDRHALLRVLDNLIGNASKYSGNGSTIRVLAERDPDGATLLSVVDNGPGIPAEYQSRLFERFFRGPGAESRTGTGIGLAIVHEYVTRQGGSAWCESAPGAGTTFRVRLPVQRPESPPGEPELHTLLP